MGVHALPRRRLIQGSLGLASLGLLAGCGMPFGLSARPARGHRIGWLINGDVASYRGQHDAFWQGMRELGYVEGRDVTVEERYAEGRDERYPELAAELVRLDVELILTAATPAIRALGQATTTIPVVFATGPADPVAEGLVASLARPGGNMTGLTLYAGEEQSKRVQLFKEALPSLSRVVVLWSRSGAGAEYLRETEAAAQALGIQVLPTELRSPDELETPLDGALARSVGGLLVTGGPVFSFLAPRIVAWSAAHRVPGMYAISSFVEPGGLMVYAASLLDNWRRAATYVDKIFKGAKPGDLPIEKPTTFDFVVNLKTAQAIGLTIPPSVLQQATQVIQ